MAAQIDLAPTPIARLIKQTLPPISTNPHSPDNYRVSKELKAALQRAGGLFALYVAHTAAAVSRETGRQQVTPEDVLGALEEVEMDVLVGPVNEFVRAYRKQHMHKGADEDLRPTRPHSGGGGGRGSKKSGSSKRKAPSGGAGQSGGGHGGSRTHKSGSGVAGAQKKVKANVDLTAEEGEGEVEAAGEEVQAHGGEEDDGVAENHMAAAGEADEAEDPIEDTGDGM